MNRSYLLNKQRCSSSLLLRQHWCRRRWMNQDISVKDVVNTTSCSSRRNNSRGVISSTRGGFRSLSSVSSSSSSSSSWSFSSKLLSSTLSKSGLIRSIIQQKSQYLTSVIRRGGSSSSSLLILGGGGCCSFLFLYYYQMNTTTNNNIEEEQQQQQRIRRSWNNDSQQSNGNNNNNNNGNGRVLSYYYKNNYPILRTTTQCGDASNSINNNNIKNSKKQQQTVPVPVVPSKIRKMLASMNIMSLPIPRIVQDNDIIFMDKQLKNGLKQRIKDEKELRKLTIEAKKAREMPCSSTDNNEKKNKKINDIFIKASKIAYGKNVKPQDREDFLIKYGCTGYTNEIIHYILNELNGKNRGIIEIGSGHGQWARAITDYYYNNVNNNDNDNSHNNNKSKKKVFEVVLAFDDMTDLPLNTDIYHKYTQSSHDYFYHNVRPIKATTRTTTTTTTTGGDNTNSNNNNNDNNNLSNIFNKCSCRGRILLLVYPPLGSMAIDTIKEYMNSWTIDDNDDNKPPKTIIYVGEGRGGVNGNDELFNYFEKGHYCSNENNNNNEEEKKKNSNNKNPSWILLNILSVKTSPGNKGYEKMYVFQQNKKNE